MYQYLPLSRSNTLPALWRPHHPTLPPPALAPTAHHHHLASPQPALPPRLPATHHWTRWAGGRAGSWCGRMPLGGRQRGISSPDMSVAQLGRGTLRLRGFFANSASRTVVNALLERASPPHIAALTRGAKTYWHVRVCFVCLRYHCYLCLSPPGKHTTTCL